MEQQPDSEQEAEDEELPKSIPVADGRGELVPADRVVRTAEVLGEESCREGVEGDQRRARDDSHDERRNPVPSHHEDERRRGYRIDQASLRFQHRPRCRGSPGHRGELPQCEPDQTADEEERQAVARHRIGDQARDEHDQREREDDQSVVGGRIAAAREGEPYDRDGSGGASPDPAEGAEADTEAIGRSAARA